MWRANETQKQAVISGGDVVTIFQNGSFKYVCTVVVTKLISVWGGGGGWGTCFAGIVKVYR